MILWSPKNKPDTPHRDPLDCPATYRDLLRVERHIITAIAALSDHQKIPLLTAELKSHTDALKAALDAATEQKTTQNER